MGRELRLEPKALRLLFACGGEDWANQDAAVCFSSHPNPNYIREIEASSAE